ncbi:MAG: type II toxin-antitoxin system VapB family antitoxin [Candidatus Nanopelagicales bacterium]
MALNVKNPAAEQAVRELMAVTGEGQAQAIERAARERLDRLRQAERSPLVEALLASIQSAYHDTPLTTDWLYDEAGVPR